MNMWAFPAKEGEAPAFLNVLESGFVSFFETAVPANPLKAEYLLPTLIGGLLREHQCSVKVLETQDRWFGVTYQEDKEAVQKAFAGLIKEGVYPANLWG